MKSMAGLVLCVFFAVFAVVPGEGWADDSLPAALKAGDRIVFLGDSITEQRNYTDPVEEYLVTRYPNAGFTFFNAGWSGDNAGGGMERLDRDVLALNPTVVTVCFGMNDGWYWSWSQDMEDYFIGNMAQIITALKGRGIRVVLLTPGIVDAELAEADFRRLLKEARYNNTLRKLADAVIALAKKEGIPCFDNHALMVDVHRRGKAKNRNFSVVGEKDLGIHPQKPGGLAMAYAMLKALGVPERHEAVSAESTGKGAGSYRFSMSALPFFVDEKARPILPLLPFQAEFNKVRLKFPLSGKAVYYLRFAGEGKGRFLAWQDVKDGIDLPSLYECPVMEHAQWVNTFTREKNDVYYKFWRTLGMKANYWIGAPYDRNLHKAGIDASLKLEELRRPELAPSSTPYEVEFRSFTTAEEDVADGEYIAVWSALGTFSPKKRPVGSEAEFTSGPRKLKAGWTTVVLATADPRNSLGEWLSRGKESSAYLFTVIESPVAQEAEALAGVDDGFAAWMNGKKAGSGQVDGKKGFAKDSVSFKLRLKKGVNRLLVRVDNSKDNFGFSLRLSGLRSHVHSVSPVLKEMVAKAR